MRSGRRAATLVLAVLLITVVSAGCRTAKVGGRCRAGELGRDNTHVLSCVKGRFGRAISFYDLVQVMREQTRRPMASMRQVATSASSTCALSLDGTVRCWGGNWHGELGDGSTDQYRVNPQPIPGLSGVTQIGMGYDYGCALTGSTVKCWGGNEFGQLGNGSTAPSGTPVDVVGLPPVAQIAVGYGHSCALTTANEVWCWGWNRSAQLGEPSEKDHATPVRAIDAPANIVKVVAGGDHTCALDRDGAFWCWGRNDGGQLGDGSRWSRSWADTVVGIDASTPSARATAVTAGYNVTCAVMVDRTLRCWGNNERSQLGYDRDFSALPQTVPGLDGVVDVVAGSDQTCAVTDGGRVACWGSQLSALVFHVTDGVGPTPKYVGPLDGATQIATESEHACAVVASGNVMCWGDNSVGESTGRLGGHGLPPTMVTEIP